MSGLVETRLGPQWIRVRIQNPPHNGLTPELCHQLAQTLAAAANNPEIRAILLEAQPPSFCVGADLKWASTQAAGGLSQLVRAMNQVCELMLTAPKPVITAIGGAAAGGGFSIAMCGDVRIASSRASFKLAYPQVGVSLDGGSSFRIQQLVGMGKAQGLLFEDKALNAAEARELGLIHEVVHHDRFEEHACKRLEALAAGPTVAYGESKRLMNPPEWVRERLDKEAESIDRIVKTQDAQKAIEAFLNKRAPVFEGR